MYPITKKISSTAEIRTVLLLFFLIVSSLAVGCSRATRHRIESFFFDGVPPLEETATVDSLEHMNLAHETQVDSTVAKAPTWSFHPASETNECKTCHDKQLSFRLIAEPDVLCSSCHDQAEGEFIHAPVEAGDCTDCHNPHGTKNPPLLTLAGQELCFQCHDEEDVKSAEAHEGIGDTVCYECHDPHNADNEYFIR